ncbi:MAG TPA: sugar phosphate isomerase/epimerase family protein [Pirellulales bacterium]|nr:sugar phosphate isomerase/epimerase family protein [Pirellulales bacterium]
MLPALSQVCSLPSPFEKDVEDYAAGHCGAIEIWLTKLETYLQSHRVDDARRLLENNNVSAPVASFQGGLLISQGDARREHWNHFERRLELCRTLGIGTVIIAGDVLGPLDEQAFGRLQASLTQAAAKAGEHGLRLALEFQAKATYPNNLQSAAALVETIASPHLGLCLDAFHFFTGPSKESDLAYLTADKLFHVQLCDLVWQAREFAADGDRILPGDGDFPLFTIVERLHEIDYRGCVSVELMNPAIWQIPARQFGEVAVTAIRKVLGLASMS